MAEFEAAFEMDIPCDYCKQPAHWRSFGHVEDDCGGGGGNPPPPYYKCTDCYMAWRERVKKWIDDTGVVGCVTCSRKFTTPEAFSDYRRF